MSGVMNGWSRRYNGYINKLFGGEVAKTETPVNSYEAKLADIDKKAKLMQADYTRKTTALAEERKAMKLERDEMMTKISALQDKLNTYEAKEEESKE